MPAGTALDDWNGRVFVSVVGFLFLDTRVRGIGIPCHRDFDEVNLRFYVRREVGSESRRGVVFVREIVPRRAIALVARLRYGERYVARPMRHRLTFDSEGELETGSEASYEWRQGPAEVNRWASVRAGVAAPPAPLVPGSEAEFITEHYWGYSVRRGRTVEYRVQHPSWQVRPGSDAVLTADANLLWGKDFVEPLAKPPVSAFFATGSAVEVHRGAVLSPVPKRRGD